MNDDIISAEPGTQKRTENLWMPACAGMTISPMNAPPPDLDSFDKVYSF